MNITENLIKNYTDEITYKRGNEYYKSGKVINLEVSSEPNKYFMFKVYRLSAWVESSDYDEYNVEIVFNDKSGFMNFKCDCQPFYEGYKRKGLCKHIVAVLIKYARDYNVKNVKATNTLKVEKLVRDLKSSMMKASNLKRELVLQIKYCYDKTQEITSFIELKVGLERTYVVKNIKDFLRAIESGEELEFGKGFIYKPIEQRFNEEDKKILDLLMENLEIDNRANGGNIVSSSNIKFFSGKKVMLLDKQLGRLLNLMKERTIECNIQGIDYSGVMILEENMPLSFNLKLENEKILLLHEGEMPRPLTSNGRFFFYQNNIYIPGNEQLKVYIPFYNAFMSDRSYHMTFEKEDGDKIASFIVPGLKKISSSLKLDPKIEKNFYEAELKVKLLLDKEQDSTIAVLKFNYGNLEINPLKEEPHKNENGILIRDIDTEIGIMTLLESFGFAKDNDRYILREEEKLVAFLQEGIGKLQEVCDIYYSEIFKNIKLYGTSSYKSSVRLNDEDLLEFSFNIEGVDREELKDIFKALREKKKYYKLKKGGFVALEEDNLLKIGDILEYLDIKDSELLKDSIILSKYNALYIDQSLKDNDMFYIERNRQFKELINNIKDVNESEYTLPFNLDKVMRNYQKIGFKWFKTLAACGFGGILADEMGLGKTLQTIAFIASEIGTGPSIVIAPTSLVYNWKNEIEKFTPELNILVIYGNKTEREELRKQIEKCDIVITSYPLIRRDIEEYRDVSFKYCILDEAQQIKNPQSLNAASVKEIRAKGYFALTGTPIENSLTELWSIFDFIMPGYLLNHHRFVEKYETPISKNKDRKSLEELNKHIKPFILRRLKKDVIKELPPKIEYKLVVEMTEEQKKIYAAYLNSAKNQLYSEIREKGFNKSRIKILAILTRLRQICCDPSVFLENYQGESGKLQALDDLLEETINEGHRVLLFSQFTAVLKNIGNRLKLSNIEYLYLDGATKIEERGKLVNDFNEGKGSVFLISLKAGGTGLNLTGADVVIHFDPWWNPAVEDQATDRAHRIGQRKTVEVIKLIAQGTIEEKIFNLQEKKKEIIENVMSDELSETNFLSQMTENEIEELFRI